MPRVQRDDPPDLTIDQVASLLNCSPLTVRRMVKAGRLRTYRLGRALRITPDEIEALRAGER